MGGPLKVFTVAFMLVAATRGSVAAPQGDLHSEYPNGAFNDPVPNNENNQKFKEYAAYLTRFDEWVTGKKVPIPADPETDALHQSLPPNAPNFAPVRVVRNPSGFDDPVPQAIPEYNEYIRVLTRFDPYVTGRQVGSVAGGDGHAVYKREDKPDDTLISADKDFGDNIEDKVPETSTSADPQYGDFIKELKRFDPWLTGRNVTIPHNTTADQVWNSGEGKDH